MFFLLVSAVFFLVKLFNIAPKLSDENTWFYAAKLLSQEQLPYRDFFQAHVPGQIALYALPIKLFGFHLTLLKLFPVFFSLGTAYLLFRIVRSQISDFRYQILAPVFFLFSFTVLATTDHASGVHEAVFFLTLAWYFLSKPPTTHYPLLTPLAAGFSLFLGLLVRPYILPAALGFAAALGLQRKIKEAATFLFSGLAFYAAVNFALWQAFGEEFLTQAWRYHLLKTEGIVKARVFSFFLQNEWAILLLGLTGIILAMRPKIRYWLPLSAALAQLAFLLLFSDIYYLYLVTLVPFLAYFAALGLHAISGKYHIPYSKYLILLVFAAFINFLNYQQNHAPTSVVTDLDRITRELKSTTEPGDTIFGSFTVTPLIALESGLPISENQVDTNAKRYLTGLLTAEEATRLATGSAVFVQTATVDPSGEILVLDPDFVKQYTVRDSCSLWRTYPVARDYEKNAILIWRCK